MNGATTQGSHERSHEVVDERSHDKVSRDEGDAEGLRVLSLYDLPLAFQLIRRALPQVGAYSERKPIGKARPFRGGLVREIEQREREHTNKNKNARARQRWLAGSRNQEK